MYVLNEYMEFGVDAPHIATYNFKLVFHLLFSTIYSMIVYLKGIVYHMKNYFTSRVIFKDREIWFNKNYNWRQKYCTVLSKAIFL